MTDQLEALSEIGYTLQRRFLALIQEESESEQVMSPALLDARRKFEADAEEYRKRLGPDLRHSFDNGLVQLSRLFKKRFETHTVLPGQNLIIRQDTTFSNLTIEAGGSVDIVQGVTVVIAEGGILIVSGELRCNGTLKVNGHMTCSGKLSLGDGAFQMESRKVLENHQGSNLWVYPPCFGHTGPYLPMYMIGVDRDGMLYWSCVAGTKANSKDFDEPLPFLRYAKTPSNEVEEVVHFLMRMFEGRIPRGSFKSTMTRIVKQATQEEKQRIKDFLLESEFNVLFHARPKNVEVRTLMENGYEMFKVIWECCVQHYGESLS